MSRKSTRLTLLLACLAGAAMLATPSATASGDHYYTCADHPRNMYRSRQFSSQIMIYLNYFLDYAEHRYEVAHQDMMDNAGNPGMIHLIASDAKTDIVDAGEGLIRHSRRLHRILRREIQRCPALFGTNLAQLNNAFRTGANRVAELRDMIDAAAETYSSDGE